METLINRTAGPSGPTAAAPRRVILDRTILKDMGSFATDAKTTAASCTSFGLPFSISLSIAAPPERSRFLYDLLAGIGSTPSSSSDGEKDGEDTKYLPLYLRIVAAHDDSVLVKSSNVTRPRFSSRVTNEYFLYDAGAGRTPSLYLLPGCYFSNQFERDEDARQVPSRKDKPRYLSFKDTGILRRGDGEGEVLVAQLEVEYYTRYSTAELCVLRPGAQDWVLKQVPIVHHEGESVPVRGWTEIDAAVSVGSRFMCWVDYLSGFLLCHMTEEDPKLRYVPLPVSPPKMCRRRSSDRPDMHYCRKLAAAGPGAMRLVSVAPRSCCGGPGETSCERSAFAFNVTTWTLTLRTEEAMAWVKDGVLDCDELWQLPDYGRLPRVAPQYPIVSCDDPDIICCTICENHYETGWMVEINMRSKALLSVVRSDTKYYVPPAILPVKLHW